MRKISIRRNVCNLAALVLAATAIAMPSAQAAETTPLPYHITWDNFRSGFADDGPGAKWFSPPTGSFPHGDRIATTNDGKLSVVPAGLRFHHWPGG
jgi:hypothetical protein